MTHCNYLMSIVCSSTYHSIYQASNNKDIRELLSTQYEIRSKRTNNRFSLVRAKPLKHLLYVLFLWQIKLHEISVSSNRHAQNLFCVTQIFHRKELTQLFLQLINPISVPSRNQNIIHIKQQNDKIIAREFLNENTTI